MADAGRQVAFRQHGVISVAVDGLGQTQRDLSLIGKAGAQAHMQMTEIGMKASKALDERSRKSFQTLKSDMASAESKAQKGRADALAAMQESARLPPPEPTPDFAAKFPNVAAEQAQELNAMKANMNEFRRDMATAGVDVGDAATMQQDLSATMGGEAEDRKMGQAVLDNMLKKQKDIVVETKKRLDLSRKTIKHLEKQHKFTNDRVKLAQEERKIARAKHGKDSKEFKKAEANVKRLERQRHKLAKQLEKEADLQVGINEHLKHTESRVEALIDDKNKQINTDRALSAVESKRRKEESKGQRDYKQREKDNNTERRKTIDNLKLQRDLTIQFNRQVESMANSFKTTLVGALAVSTAATMAFFNKLDGVRQTFMAFEEELMNAQSIFQTNQETLFGLSDQIVSFGNNYGISMQDASQGLYTLASAGLDANESMDVLGNTLKLSMAVQGDHETIAKLTTQTIFGFGLQMTDSAELTDKFAHSINKSLIEYQDLASAVKFAMPFFVSTGQNIDQLLGSLEVLTNRALEAGIAGRGLRQALAEFAQHANDNEAAFRKLGVEIMDAEGNFKMLTEIAKEFQTAMGPAASDVDLMTTLLEDLNVRGATAFVHLVQNADEFEAAVNDLSNSAGSATEMADVQQQSLARSIQLIKNSLMTPFLMSDAIGMQAGHLNEFSLTLHNITKEFHDMIVVMENGVAVGLTPLGQTIKEFVISALHEFHDVVKVLITMIHNLSKEGHDLGSVIRLMTAPLKIAIKVLDLLGPRMLEYIIIFKTLNALLPIQNALVAFRLTLMSEESKKTLMQIFSNKKLTISNMSLTGSYSALALSQAGSMAILLAMVAVTDKIAKGSRIMAAAIGAAAGAMLGLAMAIQLKNAAVAAGFSGPISPFVYAGLVAGTAALFAGLNVKMQDMMKPPKIDYENYDTGGRIMYDTGGPRGGGLGNRHMNVMVEPGETIVPKTQNMLGSGITLNIQGDVVTDNAEEFSERIMTVLPVMIRQERMRGGL